MEDKNTWIFPENVGFENINLYMDRFRNANCSDTITFDLTRTRSIHSSFIGFLIHAKHSMKKNGGTLCIILSLTVERILIMLNILDFFAPDVVVRFGRKTA